MVFESIGMDNGPLFSGRKDGIRTNDGLGLWEGMDRRWTTLVIVKIERILK